MQEGGKAAGSAATGGSGAGGGWLRSLISFLTPPSWRASAPDTIPASTDATEADAGHPPTKRAKVTRDIALPRRTRKQAEAPAVAPAATNATDAAAPATTKATAKDDGDPYRSRAPWKKREDGVRLRKRAILMGFNGAGYYGMQRNQGFDTIEEDLLSAMLKANLIPKEGYARPQAIRFQRCARTDKSVSAARQIVSLEMFPDEDAVSKMNALLPPGIRVFAVIRSTKGFNAKKACTARRYEYLLPTYALSPKEMPPLVSYRVTQEQLDKFQEVLSTFVGTHRFHNYTSGKKMRDPSAKRHMLYFKHLPPFERDGMEWIRIQVKGQSFMLHQIRKMIGMAVAVARGFAVMEDVYSTFNHESVDVPRIPGLGLYLDSVFFDFYNKKFQQSHPPLSWEEWDEEIEAFKADQIVSEILRQEKKHEIIKQWLSNLYHHKYEARCRHAGNSPLPAPATQDGDNDEDEDDDDDENGDGDEQRGEQEEGTSRASA